MKTPFMKKFKCSLGHWHVYPMMYGPPIDPDKCIWEYMDEIRERHRLQEISSRAFTKEQDMIELTKSNKHLHRREQKMKAQHTSHNLHQDSRSTVVLINNKIYELTLSKWTKDALLKASPKDRPHVRMLNPIPERSTGEQSIKNKDDDFLHELYTQIPKQSEAKVIKEKVKSGESQPGTEVEKLISLKNTAAKAGDIKAVKRIRRLLRKLDSKRHTTNKGE